MGSSIITSIKRKICQLRGYHQMDYYTDTCKVCGRQRFLGNVPGVGISGAGDS